MALRPGQIIADRYQIDALIGIGGMGAVYRATNLAISKPVALKLLSESVANHANAAQRFVNEGIAASRASHPAIIEIYDAGTHEGLPWMAMELLVGLSLREILERHITLMPSTAVAIAAEVLDGLAAAHERGIIHRDLKPDNIFLSRPPGEPRVQVKILDFGIAKLADGQVDLTATATVLGTAHYLSPEQADNASRVDTRTDLYAIGVILYEALSGQRPHRGENFAQVIRALFTQRVTPLSEVALGLPEALSDLVMRCLEHDRQQRPEDASTLAQLLRESVGGHPSIPLDIITRTPSGSLTPELLDTGGGPFAQTPIGLDNTMAAEEEEPRLPGAARLNTAESLPRVTPAALRRAGAAAEDGRAVLNTAESLPAVPRLELDDDDGLATREALPRHQQKDEPRPGEEPEAPPDTPATPSSHTGLFVGIALGVLLLIGLVAWAVYTPSEENGAARDEVSLTGEPLVMVWPPTIDAAVMHEETEDLRLYLEEKLGQPVVFEIARDYTAVAQSLIEHKAELAVFPPLTYARTQLLHNNALEPLAVWSFDGSTGFDALLIVRHDDEINRIEQLQGARFCITEQSSTSGYLLPRAYLRDLGFDPDTFIGDVQWTGSHLRSLRDLIAGKCQAATTYAGLWLTARKQGIPTGQLKMLAVTGRAPQDLVVARPGLSPERLELLRSTFLGLNVQEAFGRHTLGGIMRLTGFEPPENSNKAYQKLATAYLAELAITLRRRSLDAALDGALNGALPR